jgi:hypothetical protein
MIRRAYGAVWTTHVGLLAALAAAGCASPERVDLVRSGAVQAERAESNLVDLSIPDVYREDSTLVVSGTVTRKPGVDGPIPGHLQILFLTKDGGLLDELDPLLNPREIPTTGSRQSRYVTRYGWLPPNGTRVRAEYGEHEHEPFVSGGSSGKPAGSGKGSFYTRTPGTKTQSHQRGTPGTPPGGGR